MTTPPPTYTDADQAYYEQVSREQQTVHNTSNYLFMGRLAFRTCVHSFLHTDITDKESKCILAVSKKYIATSLRGVSRLAELQALAVKRERERLEDRVKNPRRDD